MFYKLYSEKKEKKEKNRIYLPTYPYLTPVGRVWANWNIFNGGL